MKRTCKQCGKEFIISNSEISFYKSKNLSIPKRCKDCRKSNKSQKKKTGYKYENNINDISNKLEEKLEENFKSDTITTNEEIATAVSEKTGLKLPKWLIGGAVAVIGVVAGGLGLSGVGNNDTGNISQPASITTVANEPDNIYDSDTAYEFRNSELLMSHYEKHGIEMGFESAEEYEDAASDVINSDDALYKTESEDGDHVYYIEETNEFVVLSVDGYIRTYFNPEDGIEYYERQ